MKKSLVLAMAMALGVTASAYAANPFSDVPAGHWAYDSIDKLAAAGIIDGMGDGTFQGDRNMTRYEMAQIVAKAMAKGANVEKLAAEFADELDALGVRVAALEKKADNVKIAGQVKASIWNFNGASQAYSNRDKAKTRRNLTHKYRLRTDLLITGQINEDWQYHGRIRNEQFFDNGNAGAGETTDVRFMEANVTGRIGGVKVMAGRYSEWLEDGDVLDYWCDGVVASYGKDIKLTAGYSQLNDYATSRFKAYDGLGDSKFAYARLDGKLGVVKAHAGYYAFHDIAAVADDAKILAVGINAPLTKDIALAATYFKTDADKNYNVGKKIDDDGFTVALNYKGASAKKVGSWGLNAKYYDLPSGVAVYHTMDGFQPASADYMEDSEGFKGFKVGGAVTLAKNIRFSMDYYGLKGKENGKHYDTLYSMLRFDF